jgi:hypothetical protein
MRALVRILSSTTLLAACSQATYAPRLRPATNVPAANQIHGPLKAHLRNGDVIAFSQWQKTDTTLEGYGTRYDMLRRPTAQGSLILSLDSIALLEGEVRTGSRPSGRTGMIIWSVVWGITTGACLADPKSCFGSCPTFYVATDSGEALAAEGFSASIARALEAKDIDALFPAHAAGGGPFTVRMRDEALETHAVRGLRLLAVPRPSDGRVFTTPTGEFYPATAVRPLTTCHAGEGDCTAELVAPDGIERTSPADSTDLATRETIELTFPAATGHLGLVLAARQSLMSTYLFYQTMGFLGTHAGDALATLERGGPTVASRAMGMARLIAPVEASVWNGDDWVPVGVHDEAGPLATQVEVMPFSHHAAGPVRVRLSAVKGAWRLDWAALADLGNAVTPVAVDPDAVLRSGAPDSIALARLLDPTAHLVAFPGDTYDVVFRLPDHDGAWELFLESEGYYYEWMRGEWQADEDPRLAAMALTDPAQALRVLAPSFKRAEPLMEQRFWSSRFGR